MPYDSRRKQREAVREAVRRYRARKKLGITLEEAINPNTQPLEGITLHELSMDERLKRLREQRFVAKFLY